MPGPASLQARHYYAHPRNSFWRVLESAWAIPATAGYDARIAATRRAGIAVWDVLASCERHSSQDSDIVPQSMVFNDFREFLLDHRAIRAIAFNGGAAARLFRRHVLPGLPVMLQQVAIVQLPSTSPANAAMTLAEKCRAWAELKTWTGSYS